MRPARPSTPGGQPTCDPAREQGDGGSAGTPGSRCTQQASGHGAHVGPSLSHPLGGLCPLPQKSRGDCALGYLGKTEANVSSGLL